MNPKPRPPSAAARAAELAAMAEFVATRGITKLPSPAEILVSNEIPYYPRFNRRTGKFSRGPVEPRGKTPWG